MHVDTKPRNRHRDITRTRHSHRSIRLAVFLVCIIALLSGGVYVFNVLNQYKNDYFGTTIPEIKSGITNVCLDVRHNNNSPGAEVDSATCNGRPSQLWSAGENEITHNNYCLTAPGTPVNQNAQVVIEPCNGQAGQVWLSSYLNSFENPSTGQCLDIPSGQVGHQLIAGPCNDLTGPDETWAASTWHKANTSPAAVTCDFSSEGEQIGCDAAKQWIVWNNGDTSHKSLLSAYTDGNAYEEWCADFVSYVYKEAGYPLSGGERDNWDEYLAGDVQYDGNFTPQQAGSYTPQPGDVAYFDYPGGHVEIVLLGGAKPIFVYGDSAKIDASTGNGNMAENNITQDANSGQVIYYLTPS